MNNYDIYRAVERLAELIKVSSRKAGAEYGLQQVQLSILQYLDTCNRFSDTAMAVTEYLGQTKGTVSQSIKVLENKGLLEKVADEKDKRTQHLQLTANGRKLLQDEIPDKAFNAACGKLSESERDEIQSGLRRLTLALIHSSGTKTFGVCKSCKYNESTREGYRCGLLNIPLANTDVDKICKEHQEA